MDEVKSKAGLGERKWKELGIAGMQAVARAAYEAKEGQPALLE